MTDLSYIPSQVTKNEKKSPLPSYCTPIYPITGRTTPPPLPHEPCVQDIQVEVPSVASPTKVQAKRTSHSHSTHSHST